MKFPSSQRHIGARLNPAWPAISRQCSLLVSIAVCFALFGLRADSGISQEQRPANQEAQAVLEQPLPRGEGLPPRMIAQATRPQTGKVAEKASQAALPKDFEAGVKRDFDKLTHRDVTFPRYLELRKQEYHRLDQLKKSPQLAYVPVIGQKTACGNGDFESGLNAAEWQGAYGMVPPNGNPIFSSFTDGIIGGALNLSTSHQTLVSAGTDPNVGIPLTAPGSTRAVRIGNAVNGAGSELLSKTFVVTPAESFISFWYAVVLQDPGHQPFEQPSFWVRVSAAGTEIPGLVNLGNGTGKLVANSSDPFFQKKPSASLVYKDWTCAQINLSQQMGKTVTIEFVTEDCTQGGHYAYAYIDNFCGSCAGSPTGSITFSPSTSTNCGPGQLCFNYTLPQNAAGTGSVKITLSIYQGGALVPLTTISSNTLTTGSSYCFPITPLSIPGINTSLGYFDFVATAAFTLGGTALPSMSVGTVPFGQTVGINNDYKIVCDGPGTTSQWCCPGPNLVKNGDFEAGNSDFTSSYHVNSALNPGATLPGEFNVVTGIQAAGISPNWIAADHGTCNPKAGKFMVINGKTTQPMGTKSVIWRETIPIKDGASEYQFCANVKNLPQCTFDIKPKIEVKFSSGNTTLGTIGPIVVNVPSSAADACIWQLISGTVNVPTGVTSLRIDILLAEDGPGDGNDLALDDISLQRKTPVPTPYVLPLNHHPFDVPGTDTTHYTIKVDYPPGLPSTSPPNCGYSWEVCQITGPGGAIVAGTLQSNPSAWWTFPSSTFSDFQGYNGTSTLSPLVPPPPGGANPGRFEYGKWYRITFTVACDCLSRTKSVSEWMDSAPMPGIKPSPQKVLFIPAKSSAGEKGPFVPLHPISPKLEGRPLPKAAPGKAPGVRP